MSTVIAPTPQRRMVVFVGGVVAAFAFITLRFIVASGDDKPLAVDVWWHDLMVTNVNDALLITAWVPAVVGGTIGMFVVGVILIGLFLWHGRRWDAATLAAAMIIVVGLGATMAAMIGRKRPEDSLAESVATSFPSGHTAVATTVVVVLGLLLRRWYVWSLGVVWVLLMMWSRTYLHAHWLSDVVAGLCEGTAVALLVWVGVQAARDRRATRAVDASSNEQRIESEAKS